MPQGSVKIDCEEVWRQISSYLDDEVDAALHAILTAHFKECGHCRAVLDGARNVVTLIGDGKAFELPAGARNRFYKKLEHELGARDGKAR